MKFRLCRFIMAPLLCFSRRSKKLSWEELADEVDDDGNIIGDDIPLVGTDSSSIDEDGCASPLSDSRQSNQSSKAKMMFSNANNSMDIHHHHRIGGGCGRSLSDLRRDGSADDDSFADLHKSGRTEQESECSDGQGWSQVGDASEWAPFSDETDELFLHGGSGGRGGAENNSSQASALQWSPEGGAVYSSM